jgi:hypothetical protein
MKFIKWISPVLIAWALVGCGSSVVREGNPNWVVPLDSHMPCNSIVGIYQDRGLLFRQFVDSSTNHSRSKFSVTQGFGRNIPQRPLSLEELRQLGAISGNQVTAAQMKNYAEQRERFTSTARTKIENTPSGIRVILYGGDGLPYSQSDIAMGHPDVGCDTAGRLILRESSRTGGAELTPGEADVSEMIFEKSSSGSLEVHRWSRNWVRTMQQPPTKKTESVLSFPPVQ